MHTARHVEVEVSRPDGGAHGVEPDVAPEKEEETLDLQHATDSDAVRLVPAVIIGFALALGARA